jgi:KipI family sensor histidine kinase inhibitor
MNLVQLSESSLLVLFEQKIDHEVFQQVTVAARALEAKLSEYIIDMVPAYGSILLVFRLQKISGTSFSQRVVSVLAQQTEVAAENKPQKPVEVPVFYGSEVAFDIEQLAAQHSLSVEQVISIHSQTLYDVFATGFAPGFSYLGIVDERIATPRKQTPRLKVPAGSLALAERQTAVYPSDSPGGWQIIGRTPLSMIDYSNQQLTRFRVGDQIRFVPITRDEFIALGGSLDGLDS